MSESHSVMSSSLLMDYRVRRILQARILEWVAFPFSRESFQPRDRAQVSHIADGFFTSWATGKPMDKKNVLHRLLLFKIAPNFLSFLIIISTYDFACPWDFQGKDTGVGCHFLLQGIFPTQGSNPGLLHCRQIL